MSGLAEIDRKLAARLAKLEAQEREARERGDLGSEAEAIEQQAFALLLLGHAEDSKAMLDAAIARFGREESGCAEARLRVARAATSAPDPEDLERALALYTKAGDESGIASVHSARAGILKRRRESLPEAREAIVTAIGILRRTGGPRALFESLVVLAGIEFALERWEAADAALAEADALFKTSDLDANKLHTLRALQLRVAVDRGQIGRVLWLLTLAAGLLAKSATRGTFWAGVAIARRVARGRGQELPSDAKIRKNLDLRNDPDVKAALPFLPKELPEAMAKIADGPPDEREKLS